MLCFDDIVLCFDNIVLCCAVTILCCASIILCCVWKSVCCVCRYGPPLYITLLENLRFFPQLHGIKARGKNIQNGSVADRRRSGREFAVTSVRCIQSSCYRLKKAGIVQICDTSMKLSRILKGLKGNIL